MQRTSWRILYCRHKLFQNIFFTSQLCLLINANIVAHDHVLDPVVSCHAKLFKLHNRLGGMQLYRGGLGACDLHRIERVYDGRHFLLAFLRSIFLKPKLPGHVSNQSNSATCRVNWHSAQCIYRWHHWKTRLDLQPHCHYPLLHSVCSQYLRVVRNDD